MVDASAYSFIHRCRRCGPLVRAGRHAPGGEWTRGFFGTENLARFQTAMEGHSGPIVYYIAAILVGFFPWSIVLPAAVWFSVRDALSIQRTDSGEFTVGVLGRVVDCRFR